MKKSSVVQRYNVSVRGGTERVRYYASVGYVDNSGLYNVDKNANTYKTNANYENYSLRGNVDINVTKKFVISLDIASLMAKWNYPGAYSNSSFTTSRFGPMTGIFSESKLTLPMSTVMKSPPFETTHLTTPPRVSTVKGLFSSTLPVSKR